MCEEVSSRDVVVDGTDDRSSIPGGQDVLLDLHDDTCLCTCLIGLQYVEVHLVSVEVCVVGRTYAQVEPECLSLHDLDAVRHHGHPVQRRLPVEQDDISVYELSLDGVSDVETLGDLLGVPLGDPDLPSVGTDDVVRSGDVGEVQLVRHGTAPDDLPDLLDVVLVHAEGNGELPCCERGYSDIVDGEQRIG